MESELKTITLDLSKPLEPVECGVTMEISGYWLDAEKTVAAIFKAILIDTGDYMRKVGDQIICDEKAVRQKVAEAKANCFDMDDAWQNDTYEDFFYFGRTRNAMVLVKALDPLPEEYTEPVPDYLSVPDAKAWHAIEVNQ